LTKCLKPRKLKKQTQPKAVFLHDRYSKKQNTTRGAESSTPRSWPLKNGDQVEFKVSRGAVTILPKSPVAKDSDDTLTSGEAKIVRRGEAQLKRGKSKPWRVVKHALER